MSSITTGDTMGNVMVQRAGHGRQGDGGVRPPSRVAVVEDWLPGVYCKTIAVKLGNLLSATEAIEIAFPSVTKPQLTKPPTRWMSLSKTSTRTTKWWFELRDGDLGPEDLLGGWFRVVFSKATFFETHCPSIFLPSPNDFARGGPKRRRNLGGTQMPIPCAHASLHLATLGESIVSASNRSREDFWTRQLPAVGEIFRDGGLTRLRARFVRLPHFFELWSDILLNASPSAEFDPVPHKTSNGPCDPGR